MPSISLWRSTLILLIAHLCLVHCQKAPSTAPTKHQSHGPLFSNGTSGKPKGGLALIAAGCPNGNNRHKRQFANCHYRLGFVGVAATGAAGVGAASQFRQYNGAGAAAGGAGGQAAAMPQGGGGAMAGGMPGGQAGAMPQGGGGGMPQQAMGGGYPAMGAAGAGGGGGMGMGMGMGGAGAGGAPQRQPPPGSPSRDAALKLVMDALLAAAVPPMGPLLTLRHFFTICMLLSAMKMD